MKKIMKAEPFITPMPVMIVCTKNEDGSSNAMTAAWGGIIDSDRAVLSLDRTHKTAENLKKRMAFSIGLATKEIIRSADYVGMVSRNDEPRKIAKSGLHFGPAGQVDAPICEECPLVFECKVEHIQDDENGFYVYGKILRIMTEESCLTPEGKPDLAKMGIVCFDPCSDAYYEIGDKVGDAFSLGSTLIA